MYETVAGIVVDVTTEENIEARRQVAPLLGWRAMRAALVSVTAALLLTSCAGSKINRGQQLFTGCEKLNLEATRETGSFVCKGDKLIAAAFFGGNGRTCGTCHRPGDNFGLGSRTVKKLPSHDPLFVNVPGLEDSRRLRRDALIHVKTANIDEFRTTPKLIHLQRQCSEEGICDALGQLGDRVTDLCAFAMEAIGNHMTKTVKRRQGTDFRLPTEKECDQLIAYMLSDRVAQGAR